MTPSLELWRLDGTVLVNGDVCKAGVLTELNLVVER